MARSDFCLFHGRDGGEQAGKRRQAIYVNDALGLARPELHQYLEPKGSKYTIRLPENPVLQRQLEPLLTPPLDNELSHTVVHFHELRCEVANCEHARRVVAQVKWYPGQLFPEISFAVTNLTAPPRALVYFYNGRGTGEQWIKEGKYARHGTRLSCHRFVADQVRLALFVLAYNLGNFLRRLALPASVPHWSLRSLQVKLVKMGAKVVHHAPQVIFQLAEVAVPEKLFTQIL